MSIKASIRGQTQGRLVDQGLIVGFGFQSTVIGKGVKTHDQEIAHYRPIWYRG